MKQLEITFRCAVLFLCILVMVPFAEASTIVAISGGGTGGTAIMGQYQPPSSGGGQFVVTRWSQMRTYTNVSITVPLYLFGSAATGNPGTYHGTAYLTTSIGPGTTTAVASTSFVGSNTAPQTVQLFSGLTLGPGNYFLTLAGLDQIPPGPNNTVGYVWPSASVGPAGDAYSSKFVSSGGVTFGIAGLTTTNLSSGCGQSCINYAFPPASTFQFGLSSGTYGGSPYVQFSVTGDTSDFITSASAAQLASGGNWMTTITLINTDTGPVNVSLNFYDNDGYPLQLPLTFPQNPSGAQTTSTFTGTLNAGAELVIISNGPASQPTKVGWAQLLANGNVSGSALFAWGGSSLQEATAPFETSNPGAFVLSFDNTNGYATGVALVNTTTQSASVGVLIRDDAGAILLTTSIVLPGYGHTSFYLSTNYPVTSLRRGTVEYTAPSNGKINVLGIRFCPTGAFSSIPVIAK
jgi:hypothetical protein